MSKSPAMNTFIEEINRIRRERGLNQVQVGELIGTQQGNVSRLLRGDENPTIERCEEIAAKLGYRMIVKFEEIEQLANV
jgi:transcriptional regulator with XRE-family HTH domain